MLANASIGDHTVRRAVLLVFKDNHFTTHSLVGHEATEVPCASDLTTSGIFKGVPCVAVGRNHRAVRVAGVVTH